MIPYKTDYRLHKSVIMREREAIRDVFSFGEKFKFSTFDALILEEKEKLKVLFAASKLLKTHVNKNKAKRILRENYRYNKRFFSSNLYIAFIAKPKIITVSCSVVNAEFQQLVALLSK